MFERFTKEARRAVERAEVEARELGSRTIEAEHLLLAVHVQLGVEREELLDAFDAELLAGLELAGAAVAVPAPRPIGVGPKFGTSAKAALGRAVSIAADRQARHIGPRHLALGVLDCKLGSAARAVDRAGIDTFALWRA